MTPQKLRSANFGVPQTRARMYIIMVDAMLIDSGELQSLAHIICQVLPQSIPKEGCRIEDIMNYSYHVRQAFDQTPHMPPKSKDTWAGVLHSVCQRSMFDTALKYWQNILL